jgi:hypothetical protein
MESRKACLQDLFEKYSISENTIRDMAEGLGGTTIADLLALERYCLLEAEKRGMNEGDL